MQGHIEILDFRHPTMICKICGDTLRYKDNIEESKEYDGRIHKECKKDTSRKGLGIMFPDS